MAMAGRFKCNRYMRAWKPQRSVVFSCRSFFPCQNNSSDVDLQCDPVFDASRRFASSEGHNGGHVIDAMSSKKTSLVPLMSGGYLSLLFHRQALISSRHISSTAAIQHQEIGMPSLSPTMTQGNIAKWCKKEGDQVAAGDVLCEIETDKATLEMEAMDEGFLAKILCDAGSKDIPVGKPIAVMVDSEEEVGKFKDYKAESGQSSTPSPSKEEPKEETPPPKKEEVPDSSSTQPTEEPPKVKPEKTSSDTHDRVLASPLARKIAQEKNVSLTSVHGTGPNGRITKADVEEYIEKSGATTAPQQVSGKPLEAEGFTDIPHTQIRRITAKRLLLSKQTIPHYYLTSYTKVDNMLAFRSKLNEFQEASGSKKISINDFVLKAAAMALRKVPECNSSWNDDYIRQYHNVNISVAVQTDFGLLVPVVQNADKKGLATIAEEVKSLAEKAKNNRLKPADSEGGTFTVSNLGSYGVSEFCAIINQPQSCILAVGSTEKRIEPDSEGGFKTVTIMAATLSCDHRVVDGAIGARWLSAFSQYLEDPIRLIL